MKVKAYSRWEQQLVWLLWSDEELIEDWHRRNDWKATELNRQLDEREGKAAEKRREGIILDCGNVGHCGR